MAEVQEIINMFGGAEGTAAGSFFSRAHSSRSVYTSSRSVGGGGEKKKELANISVNYVLQLSFINLITEC